MEGLMKKILAFFLLTGMAWANVAAQFSLLEDAEKGTLKIRDGRNDVLVYRYGDQLKQGIPPEQTRSCYVHPLFSLDGQPLTDDFPADHLHHHGLFWTWPVVKTSGQETQTWHPASLRQHFSRWLKRSVEDNKATLSVENSWKLDGKKVVAKEIVSINVHPVDEFGRAIDLVLTFEAVGGPLELQGTPEGKKGYGGLTLRGSPLFKGRPISTDHDEFDEDVNGVSLRWAGLSAQGMGVAVLVSPDHPDFPPAWVLRTGYAGLINVSWPGTKSVILQPGKPVTLRYRLLIRREMTSEDHIRRAYERYIAENKRRGSQ
jgi:hypothetical protein